MFRASFAGSNSIFMGLLYPQLLGSQQVLMVQTLPSESLQLISYAGGREGAGNILNPHGKLLGEP